jgi:hypothetical protein
MPVNQLCCIVNEKDKFDIYVLLEKYIFDNLAVINQVNIKILLSVCHTQLSVCHFQLSVCHTQLSVCHIQLSVCHVTFSCLFVTFSCLFVTLSCLFVTFSCLFVTFSCPLRFSFHIINKISLHQILKC